MAYLLGVDTGGTYTDAVIVDDGADRVVASAKALTSRPDLSIGVGAAIDAVLDQAAIDPTQIAMVSLSTTLATNALVEGQGGRVALVTIGFDEADLTRAGLSDALRGDPVIRLSGGHTHAGAEVAPLDTMALQQAVAELGAGVTGFAVAATFATRNPAHEQAARAVLQDTTGLPVSCSHDLSQALGGPKRALTALLNARLIGMIDRLITACEGHMRRLGIAARLMVVRGDGALVSADVARVHPIETILSGPAASIAGASWLTGVGHALVSDIGGTTTDVCLLQDGRPKIDPQGARVGPYRTMVEAVAMRTTGLGGDSQVHIVEGLSGGLRLGPRRVMPVSLAARHYPDVVLPVLERSLSQDSPALDGTQFVVPLWAQVPQGLDPREARVADRLHDGPLRLSQAVQSRMDAPALDRLVDRGLVMRAGITPSDAAHVLGLMADWDGEAARMALSILAQRRAGSGDRIAASADSLAQMIVDQLTAQTAHCLLAAGFAEDDIDWDQPEGLAAHPLTLAGLSGHRGVVGVSVSLGVPVIGLGASAATYYGAVGQRLGTKMILPDHGGVANAIGAVVGQVRFHATGTVTAAGEGAFSVHLPEGPKVFAAQDQALEALEATLRVQAAQKARASGVQDPAFHLERDIKSIEIENRQMFIEATLRVEASGRPRIATG